MYPTYAWYLNKVLVSDLPFKVNFLLPAQLFHISPSPGAHGRESKRDRRGRREWRKERNDFKLKTTPFSFPKGRTVRNKRP